MADTTVRIPFWLIGTVTGISVIGLIGVFFYGSTHAILHHTIHIGSI